MKNVISIENFKDTTELKNLFKNIFHEIIDDESFFKNWINEYIPNSCKI
ncbi:hypothetical protein [Methanobrevibacter cuticularis]|nr:hypothetical protein [Methanobrevibacter cuticularis]